MLLVAKNNCVPLQFLDVSDHEGLSLKEDAVMPEYLKHGSINNAWIIQNNIFVKTVKKREPRIFKSCFKY